MNDKNQTVVLGGGCFWCTEAVFQNLRGVVSVVPGYAGGTLENPSYEDVVSGTSGHAEVIKVDFDPEIIPFRDILDVFFHLHDPTTLNRQWADRGTQYRSIILYTIEDQKVEAERVIKNLGAEFSDLIITELKPLDKFYEAEDYHKNYFMKNIEQPYCEIVISQKLSKLREKYSEKLKK